MRLSPFYFYFLIFTLLSFSPCKPDWSPPFSLSFSTQENLAPPPLLPHPTTVRNTPSPPHHLSSPSIYTSSQRATPLPISATRAHQRRILSPPPPPPPPPPPKVYLTPATSYGLKPMVPLAWIRPWSSPSSEKLMNGGISNSLKQAFSYCVQQVRIYEYHHYLCLLHLPHGIRKAAFALRAFNIETSRARDLATDPKTGLMRLLWWQEALNRIHSGKLIEHPVAQSLSWVISNHKISKHWLRRSLDARIADANQDEGFIPQSISVLEKYAEDTQSTLLYMTLQANGIQSTVADHAASHIGKASGLVLLLKSIPHHLNRYGKVLYLPADVAEKHGLLVKEGEQSEIRVGANEMGPGGGLSDAVFEVASIASSHLRKARELSGTVPKDAKRVLLPAIPAQVALDELERRRFDVFDSRLSKGVLGISPFMYQLKLAWHAWRNKY